MPTRQQKFASGRHRFQRGRGRRVAAARAVDEMDVIAAHRRRREAGHHRGILPVQAVARDALEAASADAASARAPVPVCNRGSSAGHRRICESRNFHHLLDVVLRHERLHVIYIYILLQPFSSRLAGQTADVSHRVLRIPSRKSISSSLGTDTGPQDQPVRGWCCVGEGTLRGPSSGSRRAVISTQPPGDHRIEWSMMAPNTRPCHSGIARFGPGSGDARA